METKKQRIYLLDNYKAVLIYLVVVGHFLNSLSYIPELRYLCRYIYIFHMPCFVFVSGFFSKGAVKDGKLKTEKVLSYLYLYLIMKLISYIVQLLFLPKVSFSLVYETGAPWYLLSLSCWVILTLFLSRYPKKIVLPVCLILGIGAGFDCKISSVFSLSRTIVFFPFFALGYYMNYEMLNKLRKRIFRLPAALFLVCTCIASIYFGPVLAPYSKIIYGSSCYQTALGKHAAYGSLLRVVWYFAAVLLALCLLQLIPEKKRWFSYIGEGTLSVYILHVIIRNVAKYAGLFDYLKEFPNQWMLLVFPFCLLLTMVLAIKPLRKLFANLLKHPFIFINQSKN